MEKKSIDRAVFVLAVLGSLLLLNVVGLGLFGRLDLTRDPRAQLAFGYGSHMCLGQHLAALEVSAFFRELLPRLEGIELAGQPEWIKAIFVGGLKSMPVRYRLKAAAGPA